MKNNRIGAMVLGMIAVHGMLTSLPSAATPYAGAQKSEYKYYYWLEASQQEYCYSSYEDAARGWMAARDQTPECPDRYDGQVPLPGSSTQIWSGGNGEDVNTYADYPGTTGGVREKKKFCPQGIEGEWYRNTRTAGFQLWGAYLNTMTGMCELAPFGPAAPIHNVIYRNNYWTCSGGYRLQVPLPTGQVPYCVREPNTVQTERNLGDHECNLMTGNPINTATGNKYQRETDYLGQGPFPLVFERHYNSRGKGSGILGPRWTSTFDRRLVVTTGGGVRMVRLTRADGAVLNFENSSGAWRADGDVAVSLVEVSGGWRVVNEDDSAELYDASGALTSLQTRSGMSQSLSYGTDGRLVAVIDAFGRGLNFAYDTQGRLIELHDPAGTVIAYGYDGSGRLSTVSHPGTGVRTYVYDEPGHLFGAQATSLLTGILDESGTRFATFEYDSASRAFVSEHANGADRIELSYLANGSTLETDAAGTQRTHGFTLIDGVYKAASITGAPCATCGPTAAFARDTNGDVLSKTDFRGFVTSFSLNARHLETSRTEASGTARARSITTIWHPSFRLPAQIDEPGKRTTFVYDAHGNLLSRTELDTASNVSRSWNYSYNSLGQVLTMDGPRTDVQDITTFLYHDCTSGYRCGRVRKITNAAGHATTYYTYDAHGQPLTFRDANGVLTTLAYDLRQRLISRLVGTEQTSFEYWPTGLLKKVTRPDGSYVQYVHDSAHRLARISDAEGNRIEYTLDEKGNRIEEAAFDASNVRTRHRTRAFDASNRLHQLMGAAGTPNVTTTYGYDDNGNRTTALAPLGRDVAWGYDELNRLISVTDPLAGVTAYAYDELDQLLSVTDPKGLVTAYSNNALGDLLEEVSPDTGITTNTYDETGNLATRTDARGAAVGRGVFSYDALNRVTQIVYLDHTVTYQYDGCMNGIGRLCAMSDTGGLTEYDYDVHGRVVMKAQTTPPWRRWPHATPGGALYL
ncbi:DUF6531 domain-containing protein [Steroidobacter flavus]|uniref:DUF6531 domain-containing protein n=1 Tax=Steroidobacter flavus TaxID=1842136 RepID=A0ABV8SZY6_9GAMM